MTTTITPASIAAVDVAIATRRAVRAFQPPPVPRATAERIVRHGSWLDEGTLLGNVIVAARVRGLDTCPQAAFIGFYREIGESLALPAGERVVCGMSLVYADPDAPQNRLVTEREPVSSFARFLD